MTEKETKILTEILGNEILAIWNQTDKLEMDSVEYNELLERYFTIRHIAEAFKLHFPVEISSRF